MNKKQIKKMIEEKESIILDDLRILEIYQPYFVRSCKNHLNIRLYFKGTRTNLSNTYVLLENVQDLTVSQIFDLLVIKIREATNDYFERYKNYYNSSRILPPMK